MSEWEKEDCTSYPDCKRYADGRLWCDDCDHYIPDDLIDRVMDRFEEAELMGVKM